MNEQFKVCGNCGNCTISNGYFVCIDPAKPEQEIVPMGARRPCFVVTPLTPRQTIAAVLAPDAPATIQ